ncbi:hypothetical protein MKW92_010673, partial [Papaver armeniacum]
MALQVTVKFQSFALLLCMYLASGEIPVIGSQLITKPGCKDRCGNVSIPYPFGIGPGCFIHKDFELSCNESIVNDIKPLYGGIPISNIAIPDGDMTAEIYMARDCPDNKYSATATLGGTFTFSSTKNKIIGMGCNTWAYLGLDDSASFGTGCLSVCNKTEDITNGSCNGVGCCQAPVPVGLKTLHLQVGKMFTDNTGERSRFNPCSYGFIVEESSFNFTLPYLKDFKNNGSGTVPVVVDWTVGKETCMEAAKSRTSYACGPNTDCIVPEGNKTIGYRCKCRWGYTGNPYLHSSTSGGCRDVDECKVVCKGPGGKCENKEGSYYCICNNGYSSEVRDNITYCIFDDQSSLSGSSQNNNLNKIVI